MAVIVKAKLTMGKKSQRGEASRQSALVRSESRMVPWAASPGGNRQRVAHVRQPERWRDCLWQGR